MGNKDYVCRLKKGSVWSKTSPWSLVLNDREILRQQCFTRDHVANLYIKVEGEDITMIEVYVYDIIFGSGDNILSQRFAESMQK